MNNGGEYVLPVPVAHHLVLLVLGLLHVSCFLLMLSLLKNSASVPCRTNPSFDSRSIDSFSSEQE